MLTATQQTFIAARKSYDRAALILDLIDSKPADQREAAMRSVIRDLCFEIASAEKMIRQDRDYIQELRGD